LIEKQRLDPELGIFAIQAISAKSWNQYDSDAVESIFAEMIDSVNFGRMSIDEAINSAQVQVNTLRKR
jgi:hypothetical protein